MDIWTQFAILCGRTGAVGVGAFPLGTWPESAGKEEHDKGKE